MSLTTSNLWEVKVGGRRCPGIVQDIVIGARSLKWDVQQAIGTSGGITIYRGGTPIESIKIVVLLVDPETEENTDEVEAEWKSFVEMTVPKDGRQPPSFEFQNVLTDFLRPRLSKVAHKAHAPPEAATVQSGAPKTWIEFIEPRPRKFAPAGPPKPAQLDSGSLPPADEQEVEIQELIRKARQIPP